MNIHKKTVWCGMILFFFVILLIPQPSHAWDPPEVPPPTCVSGCDKPNGSSGGSSGGSGGSGEPSPESNTNISIRHSNAGYEYEKAGNWTAAEEEYRMAIQYYPNWGNYHFRLAYVLDKQGRYNEAIQSYKQAIALNPRDSTTYNSIGVILFNNLGRWEEAEKWFLAAHQRNPTDSLARDNLILTVKRIRQKVSDNTFNRAFDLMEKGESAKAESLWRKQLLVNPNDAGAWKNLGVTLAGQGRWLAAEAALREAVQLDPSNIRGLRIIMESAERGNALKELMAANEQGVMATKELNMEAMRGRAMSCFDFNEDATKTIRCTYSTDHSAEISVFAPTPQRVEPTVPAAAKAKIEKDPEYIELWGKKEKIEKEYKENFEALQAAYSQRDRQQGRKPSSSAINLVIGELKNKLTEEREEHGTIEKKIETITKKYVLDE